MQKRFSIAQVVPIHTLALLSFLAACMFVLGTRRAGSAPTLLDLVVTYLFVAVTAQWVALDAGLRGYVIPKFSRQALFAYSYPAAIAYVIWSRRWRGIVILISVALLLVSASVAGSLWAIFVAAASR
jgi:hypothetical protein